MNLLAKVVVVMFALVGATLGFASSCESIAHGQTPSLEQRVRSALGRLPVYKNDREVGEGELTNNAEAKRKQLDVVARAIATAAISKRKTWLERRELAARLIAVGYHESAWSIDVHRGFCGRYECDTDSRGNVRARTPWQMHRRPSMTEEEWDALVGVELHATTLAAIEAAARLDYSASVCKGEPDELLATLAHYAGRGCRGRLKDGPARAKTYRAALARLD